MAVKKAQRKKATNKPPVPGKVVKLTEEEIVERKAKLDELYNAPVQMPASVFSARADQESKLGTGKKTGRRTGYTPDRVEAFLKNVRSGLPVLRAAALAAIPKSNLYDWAKKYSDFSDAIQQAETEYQAFALGTVNDGIANGDGHLAMKLLGARFSDEYATSKKVDVRNHRIESSISADQLMNLQSVRLNTDVVSAANVIETEEPEASAAKLTTDSPDNDGSAENDGGGTPQQGGGHHNTPPPTKPSHTGHSSDTPADATSDTQQDEQTQQ